MVRSSSILDVGMNVIGSCKRGLVCSMAVWLY